LKPSFAEALRYWLKLGFLSFGGPAGQISMMHQDLVEQRRWVSEGRFLHALTYCNLLPGPEAQQLATYCGWCLHGTWGGIAAGTLFVLPSVFILWALAWIYAAHGAVPWVGALFHGLGAAALGVVAFAALRIGRKTLKDPILWTVAAAAFAGIFFLKVPFPWIVLGAAAVGFAGGRLAPARFKLGGGHGKAGDDSADVEAANPPPAPATRGAVFVHAARVILTCGTLWWAPILAVAAWKGWDATFAQLGIFFSKAAMVTFGGAYAVLPYVADHAVTQHHWLTEADMTAGLALAETTPGPLIMVVQFVGFLGGWNGSEGLPPLGAATLGALLVTWVTFLPCFLWIFLGAPWIERLRDLPVLSAALTAISAAVVGVVLNLAVWFGLRLAFPTGPGAGLAEADLFVLAVALGSFAALAWGKVQIHWVVLAGGALGLAQWAIL
jgi:chromate transporter